MKTAPFGLGEVIRTARVTLRAHHHGNGLLVLLGTLLLLALATGVQPPAQSRIYAAGEVAEGDVIANRSLLVEDSQATQSRRDQIAAAQPTVFDLSTTEIGVLRERILAVLTTLNELSATHVEPSSFGDSGQITEEALPEVPAGADPNASGETRPPMLTLGRAMPSLDEVAASDEARLDLAQKEVGALLGPHLNSPIPRDFLQFWANPDVQAFILGTALPWFDRQLAEGVVMDARLVLPRTGIMIRNLETNIETLRPESSGIRDIQTLLANFSQLLRNESHFSPLARRAISWLFSNLVMPTLTLNREATQNLGAAVAQSVEPVYYTIQKGEVVVYQGERISREKQLKLQSLFRKADGWIRWGSVGGSFVLSLVLVTGLFMAPSGRPSSPLRRHDFLFLSLLFLVTGLGAKALQLVLGQTASAEEMIFWAFGFPVAGLAGLSALIFAARRYCVVGLLVALFVTLMFQGGLGIFLSFFLSAMLNTWLVLRAQTRQDVVRGFVPLALGLALISFGGGWLEGFHTGRDMLLLAGFAVGNAFVSLLILFAISPILEMAFGYTTRFRLMELMNLEQPLLQDLMVTIPGTYHHSLVVANLVEAGAKGVGANSLLCKVGALYHDIGKLAYPDYFIENQFNGPNRHDRLTPTMSALILGSHVKKGTELAMQYRLGDEIEAIIRQHHGTGLMKFFYKKAQDLGENPRWEEYCYPGPRPQSREAAIVMLADAVEASSRTLLEPTPARLKTHVDTILKGIFADGQLDESELTFKDLHKLSDSFARILTGLFHHRIAYPDLGKPKQEVVKAEAAKAETTKPEAAKGETGKTEGPKGEARPDAQPPAKTPAPRTPDENSAKPGMGPAGLAPAL